MLLKSFNRKECRVRCGSQFKTLLEDFVGFTRRTLVLPFFVKHHYLTHMFMNKEGLIKTILFILLYLCWTVFLKLPISANAFKSKDNIIALYEFAITFMFLVIIFLSYKDELIKEFKSLKKKDVKKIFINLFIMTFIMIIFNIVSSILLKGFSVLSVNQSSLNIIESGNALLIVRMVILSPIIEELIFRKNIRAIIDNDKFFIIFSGLLLGLLYIISQSLTLMGVISSLSYIFVGVYLSYSYTKTNNIHINIISRILYNLIMMVVIL